MLDVFITISLAASVKFNHAVTEWLTPSEWAL